jgi:thiol:disulfide interchange protein
MKARMQAKTKRRQYKSRPSPQLFILSGFLILLVALLVYKEIPGSDPPGSGSNILPEVQLERALQAHQPVLAFFHSNTCENCLIMVDTVAQVYPQYQDQITLVDINVYDEQNQALLRQVRLQYIPTLIFFDRNGQAEPFIDVMDASQLSSKLAALSGEP